MSKTERTKSDKNLGLLVAQHLQERGIETPMTSLPIKDTFDPLVQVGAIEEKMHEVLTVLGLDLVDDSLRDTPRRVAKMLVNELCWGLDYRNFPKATTVENKMKYDEMVMERNISVKSLCEHHLMPVRGVAHVAYLAKDKVLGLSKMNRIVEFFSRRPQIQERLTEQICASLQFVLETEDVAVCIVAEHDCVKMRGVEDACSDTVTSKLGGCFKIPEVRAEFFNLINLNKGN